MRRRGPYSIDSVRSKETAQALREMADMADNGELIGVAYVALRPGRKVSVGMFGVAKSDPPLVTYWLKKLSLILLREE